MALSPQVLKTLQAAWSQPGLLHYFLGFLSRIYEVLLWLQQKLYQWKWKRVGRLNCPLVVVGNVVAGGGGKTPTLIALTQHLKQKGYQVAVISRGYGRKNNQILEINSNSHAAWAGDEPLLIQQKCQVPVFVGKKRLQVAQQVLHHYPNTQVILSDDGLQHRALPRDLEIIVFDDRGLGNGRLIPAGFLREKWPRQTRSGITPCPFMVVHTGQNPAFEGFSGTRKLQCFARNGKGEEKSIALFKTGQNVALAGIAQPQAFFQMLQDEGLPLNETLALADHFDFDTWTPPVSWQSASVFCTEKDAVKLWTKNPNIWSVGLDFQLPHHFFDEFELHLQSIIQTKTQKPH